MQTKLANRQREREREQANRKLEQDSYRESGREREKDTHQNTYHLLSALFVHVIDLQTVSKNAGQRYKKEQSKRKISMAKGTARVAHKSCTRLWRNGWETRSGVFGRTQPSFSLSLFLCLPSFSCQSLHSTNIKCCAQLTPLFSSLSLSFSFSFTLSAVFLSVCVCVPGLLFISFEI